MRYIIFALIFAFSFAPTIDVEAYEASGGGTGKHKLPPNYSFKCGPSTVKVEFFGDGGYYMTAEFIRLTLTNGKFVMVAKETDVFFRANCTKDRAGKPVVIYTTQCSGTACADPSWSLIDATQHRYIVNGSLSVDDKREVERALGRRFKAPTLTIPGEKNSEYSAVP